MDELPEEGKALCVSRDGLNSSKYIFLGVTSVSKMSLDDVRRLGRRTLGAVVSEVPTALRVATALPKLVQIENERVLRAFLTGMIESLTFDHHVTRSLSIAILEVSYGRARELARGLDAFCPTWSKAADPRLENFFAQAESLSGIRSLSFFGLLGDSPHTEVGDPFGYDLLAERLARVVEDSSSSTPLSLGIQGGWGAGKSSLMLRLRGLLQDKGYKTVWFNAWTAREVNVLEELIKSVLNELGSSVIRRTLRRKKLISGLRLLIGVALGAFKVQDQIDELWKIMQVDSKTRNEFSEILESVVDEWAQQKVGGVDDPLLVVFIDDLDRCSPATVLRLFETLQLYLKSKGLIFVIGYDESIITSSVLEERRFSDDMTGRRYLDKVIQVTFNLPTPTVSQGRALIDQYAIKSGVATILGSAERELLSNRLDLNPRRAKQFINSFIVTQRLINEPQLLPIDTVMQALILLVYYPTFFALYRDRDIDPLEEFTAFLKFRSGQAMTEQEVSAAFRLHGNTPPPPSVEDRQNSLLRAFEERCPTIFADLAFDREFVSFVASIPAARDRQKLASAARMTADAGTIQGDALTDGSEKKTGSKKLSIIWIDDSHGRENRQIANSIRKDGHVLRTVGSTAELRAVLSEERFDLLLSDIAREGSQEAGLAALEEIRSESLFVGPVIFFTSRVTPDRETMAKRLGAIGVVNRYDQVQRLISSVSAG